MTVTLKDNRNFQKAYKKGAYKAGKYIVIYARKNGSGENRIGISVGRRFGNSVQRNRIKRLIRESCRAFRDSLKQGYDIVFMVRASKREAPAPNRKFKAAYVPSFREVYGETERLLKKLELLN